MTAEIDPDVRLHTRLALGRGWRLASNLAAGTLIIAALASGRFVFFPMLDARGRLIGDPGFLPFALFLLMFGPARAVARLVDLERGGLLDQTRLCGRPTNRLLTAFLVGSMWPYVVVSLLFLANHLRLQGDPASLLLALVVFAAALDVSLLAYGTLPPTMTTDSRFITPLLLILTFLALAYLRMVEWVQRLAFEDARAVTTIAIVAAVLPLAVWLAHRRLARPAQRVTRSGAGGLFDAVSRLLPRVGPPEFNRQLRCAILSGGTLATLLIAPLSMWLVETWAPADPPAPRAFSLNAIPYALMLIGAFAVSSTVRREMESRTIDLVRLTRQRPEAIALGWYAAIALPFWIATFLAAATLALVDPKTFVFTWWLPAFAAMLPAMSLAEGFQRRQHGAYLLLPILLFGFIITLTVSLDPRLPPGAVTEFGASHNLGWVRRVGAPWQLNVRVLVPAFVVVFSLGSAAGRLRRSGGPALAGAAAAAGVVATALSVRSFQLIAFPRALTAIFAVLASFVAEERDVPTPPWIRLGIVGLAALAAGSLVGREGGMDWPTSLVTGCAAATALGTGLLVHELAWRVPIVSLGLRAIVLLALERFAWRLMYNVRLASSLPRVPPALEPVDVAVVVAAFAIALVLHARARRRTAIIARA